MWKIWNKLFGWEYIHFQFGLGYFVKRVRLSPRGILYVKLAGQIYLINNEKFIHHNRKYTYLT
jgi:hypothetical protein